MFVVCCVVCCVLYSFSQALNDAKKQNHSLMEKIQSLQQELNDLEQRRADLDNQLRLANAVSFSFH